MEGGAYTADESINKALKRQTMNRILVAQRWVVGSLAWPGRETRDEMVGEMGGGQHRGPSGRSSTTTTMVLSHRWCLDWLGTRIESSPDSFLVRIRTVCLPGSSADCHGDQPPPLLPSLVAVCSISGYRSDPEWWHCPRHHVGAVAIGRVRGAIPTEDRKVVRIFIYVFI